MQKISLTSIRKWSNVRNGVAPSSISTVCPHCNDKVIISLGSLKEDNLRNSISGTGNCPSCNKKVHFWAVRLEKTPTEDIKRVTEVYMYPVNKTYFTTPELKDKIPEELNRSFVSTIDAYNSGNYPATAVCCRRTLEGIFKFLADTDKKNNLFNLINDAIDKIDLTKPLIDLSHAIRDGGNLGAHFDMEKEPDEELARQMVELLDYLISYLYILPNEIMKLEKSLGKDA
tara:strand:+ start:907 stop:1593 length:687 start_codon:yes stop_codon:yes gene_type:complete